MDDPTNNPSDTPGYQSKRQSAAAKRTPPPTDDDAPLLEVDPAPPADGPEGLDFAPVDPPVFASERIGLADVEADGPTGLPVEISHEEAEALYQAQSLAAHAQPVDLVPPALTDGLPGDAAPTPIEPAPTYVPEPEPELEPESDPEPAAEFTPTIPPTPAPAPVPTRTPTPTPLLAEPEPTTSTTTTRVSPKAVIIRPPTEPAPAAEPARRGYTRWALIWVLAWSAAMALTLNHRFDRKFDWNTAYFSVAARNLVREGFAKLHGGIYVNSGEFEIDKNAFYAGHPPMTAWLLAGWMKLLGPYGSADWAIRALPLAFTAINLLLLYALVRRVFGGGAALASTVICSLLPMTAYYAQVVNMEPFVMTFLLGGAIGYVSWSRSGSKVGFVLLCLCVILGCWTDWPMYAFAGFLAAAHLLKRREPLAPSAAATDPAAEPELAGRPIVASLVLIVLPMAVFAAFMVYLKMNDSGVDALLERAADRQTEQSGSNLERTFWGGYHKLFFENTRDDRPAWQLLVGLLTVPALLLAATGALFWRRWSRRLSLATGDAARRAAFRVLVCLLLMQLAYTLAFPSGAWVHEFWEYYLTAAIAILAGGLCTWLTVAGGAGRPFSCGLFDRLGWAVVALIPLLGAGPFVYRMQIHVPVREFGRPDRADGATPASKAAAAARDAALPDPHPDLDYAADLKANTLPGDVILTDLNADQSNGDKRGYALPWYADRAILAHEGAGDALRDTHSMAGIDKLREQFKGRRILYLWDEVGPEKLVEELAKKFTRRNLGGAGVFVIDDPHGTWKTAPAPASAPAATKPAK